MNMKFLRKIIAKTRRQEICHAELRGALKIKSIQQKTAAQKLR